jgi:hypothetical protein
MPHHFTKNTVEASVWCNACGKMTPHRVADGRQQYCLVCYERKKTEPVKVGAADAQRSLFDAYD